MSGAQCYIMLQKSNWDFMSPIQIQLTYDLTDVGEPTFVSKTRLPDINNYPVVNKAKAEKNFSVSINHLFFSFFYKKNSHLICQFYKCLTCYVKLVNLSYFSVCE